MRRELNRRNLMLAPAGFAIAGCGGPARTGRSRPNILFAIADDQSWPHAGAYGDKVVRTPAFDRVAREGVLFTHSFSASPSCTPSRSAVLMGRHVWQLEEAGVLYGTIDPKYPIFT
ncbi:MAG: sulfatase-like hydrolase/transferase, partial [Bryobacteraceae bacterium]